MAVYRQSWLHISPPRVVFGIVGYQVKTRPGRDRGDIAWFNPYNRVETLSIWPSRDASEVSQDEWYTEILNIWFRPNGDGRGHARTQLGRDHAQLR